MTNRAHLITRVPSRLGRRALTAVAAALLMAGGLYAYSAQNAPAAHAASSETGGLAVTLSPGTVTVGIGTISAGVVYTCTDASAPGGQAQLRVDFDQHGNVGTGEMSVACDPRTSTSPRPSSPRKSA